MEAIILVLVLKDWRFWALSCIMHYGRRVKSSREELPENLRLKSPRDEAPETVLTRERLHALKLCFPRTPVCSFGPPSVCQYASKEGGRRRRVQCLLARAQLNSPLGHIRGKVKASEAHPHVLQLCGFRLGPFGVRCAIERILQELHLGPHPIHAAAQAGVDRLERTALEALDRTDLEVGAGVGQQEADQI